MKLMMRLICVKTPTIHHQIHFGANIFQKNKYKEYYDILGIAEHSDQEEIRKAYLSLVKKYHPDANSGDNAKFQEVDNAFRVLMDKKSKERWDVEEDPDVQEQDIKHVAPQHRQCLNYGGIGSGTPFQRQKQYTKYRAMQASERVLQHRVQRNISEENALLKKIPKDHKIKTKYGFDRLVEDLIQEAVSKGEFSNLKGSGKPLENRSGHNPYVDFVTHKINEILIDNGFTPDWILLQKEIREEMQTLRESLQAERERLGPCPLTWEEDCHWESVKKRHKDLVTNINKQINRFNLVVPILNKQMLLLNLEKEAKKVLDTGETNLKLRVKDDVQESEKKHTKEEATNLFGLIDMIFKH